MKNKKTLLQAKQDLLNKMQADIIQVDNMLPYKKNAVLVPLVENIATITITKTNPINI